MCARIGIILAVAICLIEIASAQTYQNAFSYYGSDSGYYFPTYAITNDSCNSGQGQDFIIEIPPGACEPAVVRSDLLEEQNVPVFCRMVGLKINPLIEVPYIKSISVPQASLDKSIVGVTFHPYRAAVASSYSQLVGTPLSNELGYIVVVLKQQPVEKNMPETVTANLTARIKYDLTTAFGVGLNELLLPEIDDITWSQNYNSYGFWHGKGFARAENIKENSATIKLYLSPDKPFSSFDLSTTGVGNEKLVYLPGSYCSSGVKVKLEQIIYPQTKAEILVDGNKVEAIRGTNILDGCTVSNIQSANSGLGGKVDIKCGSTIYSLDKTLSKATLFVDGRESLFGAGDVLNKSGNYSLVFAGKVVSQSGQSLSFINAVVIGKGVTETDIYNNNIKLRQLFSSEVLTTSNVNDKIKSIIGGNMTLVLGKDNALGLPVEVRDVEGMTEATYSPLVEKYYEKSIENYQDIAKTWQSVKKADGTVIGEQALWEAASKAEKFSKAIDAAKLWQQFISTYPDSKFTNDAKDKLGMLITTSALSEKTISVKGISHTLVLQEVTEPIKEEAGITIIVNKESKDIGLNGLIGNWQLESVKENAVTFKYLGTNYSSATVTLGEPAKSLEPGIEVKLVKINLKKYARISVSPYSKEGDMTANFSVHI